MITEKFISMRGKILALAILALAGTARADLGGEPGTLNPAAELRDPVGEVANYALDKGNGRTSWMVNSGTAEAKVTQFIPAQGKEPNKYQVDLSFDLSITFVGRKKNTSSLPVPEEFFTPEFMATLRKDGLYDAGDFKIKYLDREPARTTNGKVYPECDKVLLYDIKTDQPNPVEDLLAGIISGEGDSTLGTDIKDLKITAVINEGVPVLGIVKLDISGKANGISIKMGFDYH